MRQWALLACFAIACANHGPSEYGPLNRGPVINHPYAKALPQEGVSESVRVCFENPATQEYLADLHHRIIEHWSVPYGTPTYDVAATLTLEPSGAVAAFGVGGEPTAAQSDAITRAVLTAQPFPPLTGAATCLSQVPILMKFRTALQW